MSGACAGIRVLDFSRGMAGPLATMILADYEAEVIRVEFPEDDPGWNEPRALLLNRGKKSIGLDLDTPAGQAEVRRLVGGMDVVIESMGPGKADQVGIGYAALSAVNPALVFGSITGFGTTGPFAQVKPADGLVMAKAGIYRDQPGWYQEDEHGGRRPVYRASPDASYFAAMLMVQGILAALRARDLTGAGQLVETSLLEALSGRQNPVVRWLFRDGEELPSSSSSPGFTSGKNDLAHHRDPRKVGLTGMLVECKDGRWLLHALVNPRFFGAWIQALDFEWIWDDERFKGAPQEFPRPEDEAELVRLIEARMKDKTAAEWMEIYLAFGNVCADVVETTQEALRHPQMLGAGYLAELDDPRVGRIVQVGPLARIPEAPASVRGPAPRPREHTEEILGSVVEPVVLPAVARAAIGSPLEGITILEAATYYALPFGAALLGELGARVIKIEPLGGDPYRGIEGTPDGSDPMRRLGHNNMARAMQGKESILIDLKHEQGQQIVHQLVAKADAFVHNYRPGVPESLRIDYDTLLGINPDLVYHYGGAYGSVGPYSAQPAIDPIIAAFSGLTAYQAGEGNPPLTEMGADPIGALGHATAMMLGLFARHRTGRHQYVESAMILSNLFANSADALSYEGKPPRPLVDHLQHGTGATHRLYATAAPPVDGGSRWVFLDAPEDDEFTRFCEVAGRQDLASDPRFATASARREHRAELEQALEDVFSTRTSEHWEASLLAVGVGCMRADAASNFNFLYEDPQAQAIGMMTPTEHPHFGGKYWRHAPVIRFSKTPGQARPFTAKGEHTRSLLTELGFDDTEIARLKEHQVVNWPD